MNSTRRFRWSVENEVFVFAPRTLARENPFEQILPLLNSLGVGAELLCGCHGLLLKSQSFLRAIITGIAGGTCYFGGTSSEVPGAFGTTQQNTEGECTFTAQF